ncbi:hypothetical protein ACP275_07G097200 [Erythranthe tilingii]
MELKPILLIVLFIFSSTEKIQSSRPSDTLVAETPCNHGTNDSDYGQDPMVVFCHGLECATSDDCSQYEFCSQCGDDKRCLP